MKLKDLGEFGLIERIGRSVRTGSRVVAGIGDDCAVLRYSSRAYQLVTTDTIIEGVDFTAKTPPALIGRKALAVSLSDIAACGGSPCAAVLALTLSGRSDPARILAIQKGAVLLAREFGVDLVGGDISRGPCLSITSTVLGLVSHKALALRSGARDGDFLFVTGALGGSLQGKHLTFTPRIREAQILARLVKVRAMIDISDGLAQDLMHILRASGVQAVLYERLIPLSRQAKNTAQALYDGEDFELLFAVSAGDASRLLKQRRVDVACIGRLRKGAPALYLTDGSGRERSIPAKGYRHF